MAGRGGICQNVRCQRFVKLHSEHSVRIGSNYGEKCVFGRKKLQRFTYLPHEHVEHFWSQDYPLVCLRQLLESAPMRSPFLFSILVFYFVSVEHILVVWRFVIDVSFVYGASSVPRKSSRAGNLHVCSFQ